MLLLGETYVLLYLEVTCLYIACNILTLMLAILKLFTLLLHRKDFFELVVYLQQEFLRSNYDTYERTILHRCKRICTFFICCFTCFVHATLVSYVISPIVANIGRNASDRILPFNMWGDLVTTTPYFEITFVLQALFMYQIGLCYFCFDNFLCIMTIHVAGQFRILQYRLENMKKVKNKRNHSGDPAREYCAAFTHYVQQHQALIAYCKKLEGVFSVFAFGQVLVFSMLICLDGYQVLMADAPTARRIIFVFHIMGCSSQLFMFTYSCDCLIQDSANVATAMYAAPWTRLAMNQDGKMMRRDLLLVAMRSRLPCCITACGFFAISLETYTKDMLYVICNLATLAMCLLKLFVILVHRTEFFNLIVYLQRKFLESKYDVYEKAAVDACKRNCSIYICCFTFFALATCISYILNAVVGTCVTLKIVLLQLSLLFHSTLRDCSLFPISREFRKCIQQHQTLISFCKKLEEVFRTVVLAQVITFSLLICFVGYQVVQEDLSIARRFTFINLLLSNMCHLFMFTYSCDCLIQESTNIAVAVYTGPWTDLPMNKYGKMLRMDLQLAIMRSRQPCCLTANGFFPVSLETYTSILSTAMSYFTLLRQSSGDIKTT
ncbi:odorant receptor 82a-like [Andrena cerasifolii]|uniref:odorant receptor 82a-like n=1 Tax=Andrena cerasifolii TaxID=2819439 RepID=UPI004037AE22